MIADIIQIWIGFLLALFGFSLRANDKISYVIGKIIPIIFGIYCMWYAISHM